MGMSKEHFHDILREIRQETGWDIHVGAAISDPEVKPLLLETPYGLTLDEDRAILKRPLIRAIERSQTRILVGEFGPS
jgi:hypothetical protein